VLAVAITVIAVSDASAEAVPPSAKSYYVSHFDRTWAANFGCDIGNNDQSAAGTQTHVIVLDFGSMYKKSDGSWALTAFGGPDISMPDARLMVEDVANYYYYYCTGNDTTSTLYVGLGTNNSGGDITSAAGAKLADAAQTAKQDVQDAGHYGQGRPIAADDMESWSAGSSHSTASRNWIDGYNGVSTKPFIVNYGSADGCPQTSVPNASSCNAGLDAESIWRVSWSGVAYPLPEIYTTNGSQAKQWRYLSKYSYNQHNAAFVFKGVMSQAGSCSQNGGCSGADNSPTDSWNQLNDQLDADTATATDPGPPTNIWWGP
jgi:hypothetical protein